MFEFEDGEVLGPMLKGLRLKQDGLVLEILQSLHLMLSSDSTLGFEGQENSVFFKMEELDAKDYFDSLSSHNS